jgi:hypothetical protein
MKRCLRKVLGQSRLTEEKLNTTLISIESAVKSRPITQREDSTSLIPAHFQIGEGLATIPTGSEPTANEKVGKVFQMKQKLSDFLKSWTKGYVLEQKFPRSSTSSREDHPTSPRRRRPNSRGRSTQTLVGMGTHQKVAERLRRPSENGSSSDE